MSKLDELFNAPVPNQKGVAAWLEAQVNRMIDKALSEYEKHLRLASSYYRAGDGRLHGIHIRKADEVWQTLDKKLTLLEQGA